MSVTEGHGKFWQAVVKAFVPQQTCPPVQLLALAHATDTPPLEEPVESSPSDPPELPDPSESLAPVDVVPASVLGSTTEPARVKEHAATPRKMIASDDRTRQVYAPPCRGHATLGIGAT
jgi:hypothetical protein